jgi:hypothetical protein
MSGIDSEVAAYDMAMQKRTAAEHGAIGFIGIQTRTSARTFPFEQVLEMRKVPNTTWIHNDGTSFDPANGIKASATVSPKAASTLFEGAARSLEQLLDEVDAPGARPAGFLLKTTAKLTATVRVRRYESPEVIGLIEGSDPALRNEFVVLMAHVDHLGISPGGTGDRINNGALDNAAGVATLLEVARAFATAGQRPKRSVLVIANTGEEKGLLGADYLAHYPPVPINRMVAAVDMDMPLLLLRLHRRRRVRQHTFDHRKGISCRRFGIEGRIVARSDARAGHLRQVGSLRNGEGGRAGGDAGHGHGQWRRGRVEQLSPDNVSPSR